MRLIDVDELLKTFNVNSDGIRIPEKDCDNFDIKISLKEIKHIIREQPTAYDVDKVVEELNKIKKYNLNLADMMIDIQENGTNRHFICLEDAIEIVKAGGNS